MEWLVERGGRFGRFEDVSRGDRTENAGASEVAGEGKDEAGDVTPSTRSAVDRRQYSIR